MSFSNNIPLTYTHYTNNLIEDEKEMKSDSDFVVIPPIQPLGNLFTNMNLNLNNQKSIDVLNTSTDVISTSKFNSDNKEKKQVVFEMDKQNNYVVMLDDDKYKEIVVGKKENDNYEVMKFTKDKPVYNNSFIGSFYIASITVVGLFIVYRMIQKSG